MVMMMMNKKMMIMMVINKRRSKNLCVASVLGSVRPGLKHVLNPLSNFWNSMIHERFSETEPSISSHFRMLQLRLAMRNILPVAHLRTTLQEFDTLFIQRVSEIRGTILEVCSVHRNETNACVIMDLWALGFRATKRKIT
jgi:hypothetical protein